MISSSCFESEKRRQCACADFSDCYWTYCTPWWVHFNLSLVNISVPLVTMFLVNVSGYASRRSAAASVAWHRRDNRLISLGPAMTPRGPCVLAPGYSWSLQLHEYYAPASQQVTMVTKWVNTVGRVTDWLTDMVTGFTNGLTDRQTLNN